MSVNEIDWVGIVGIMGTLGGVIVGAVATYKIQERQLRHADKTRFQDKRMEVYIQFTGSANKGLSHWRSGSQHFESVDNFFQAFEKIRMIGADSVVVEARELHRLFGQIMKIENKVNIKEEILKEFHAGVARFVRVARDELKAEKA